MALVPVPVPEVDTKAKETDTKTKDVLSKMRASAVPSGINPVWLVSLSKSKMMSRSKKDAKNPSRTILRNIKARQKALLEGSTVRTCHLCESTLVHFVYKFAF